MAQSILAPGWLWLWNWAVLLHPYSIFSWGMCSFTSYPTILFAARWIKDELISKGIFHLANICYCSQLWKLRISLMNFNLYLTNHTAHDLHFSAQMGLVADFSAWDTFHLGAPVSSECGEWCGCRLVAWDTWVHCGAPVSSQYGEWCLST